MSTALRWSLIVALGLVPISVHVTMNKYAGSSYYLEFFARWLISGIVFGAVTYVIVRSVSTMKSAIRKKSLNAVLSDEKEQASIELDVGRQGNDDHKNQVSNKDRTHDKFYEIAWDEIESGNKDKIVWAKAFSLADGAEDKAKAIYISLRVSMLGEDQKSKKQKLANSTKGIISMDWRDLEPGDKVTAIIVFSALFFRSFSYYYPSSTSYPRRRVTRCARGSPQAYSLLKLARLHEKTHPHLRLQRRQRLREHAARHRPQDRFAANLRL